MTLKNTTDLKEKLLKLKMLLNTIFKLHIIFYLHHYSTELTI